VHDLLSWFELDGPIHVTDIAGEEPGYHSMTLPANAEAKQGWSKQSETLNVQAWILEQKEALTIFFNHQWPVATDVLPANNAVGSYYTETVLLKVAQEISSQHPVTTTRTSSFSTTVPVPTIQGAVTW